MNLNVLFGEQPDYAMEKGDAYWAIHKGRPILRIACPKCGEPADASRHTIQISPDGIISLAPSYLCPHCKWHGYLKNNEFSGEVTE